MTAQCEIAAGRIRGEGPRFILTHYPAPSSNPRARRYGESFPDYRMRLILQDRAEKLERRRPRMIFVSTVLGAPKGSGRTALRAHPKGTRQKV